MDMTPWERRQKILEALCLRRHDTYGNLKSSVCFVKKSGRQWKTSNSANRPGTATGSRPFSAENCERFVNMMKKSLTTSNRKNVVIYKKWHICLNE